MTQYVRTPDDRFADLNGWPHEPRYLELAGFDGMRLHYVDEGPSNAEHTFLCLHGEPTWSYLYRKMIPIFSAAGGRVVAPDFFGFGRSDKPVVDDHYTFDFHRRSIAGVIEKLDLRQITLVCQDWGGLVGLTLPLDYGDRIDRLIAMNTTLATGQHEPPQGFLAWKQFVASQPDIDVGRLMKRAVPGLTDAEAAAYDAPFPDKEFKAGVRQFPAIVPIDRSMEGAGISARAENFWRNEWSGKSFMAIGMNDPVLGPPAMRVLHGMINGCPDPLELPDAGHFVQESGDQVARAALDYFATV